MYSPQHLARMSQECRKNVARNGSVDQLLARKASTDRFVDRDRKFGTFRLTSMTCQSPTSQAHVQAMQAAQAGTRQVELGEINPLEGVNLDEL